MAGGGQHALPPVGCLGTVVGLGGERGGGGPVREVEGHQQHVVRVVSAPQVGEHSFGPVVTELHLAPAQRRTVAAQPQQRPGQGEERRRIGPLLDHGPVRRDDDRQPRFGCGGGEPRVRRAGPRHGAAGGVTAQAPVAHAPGVPGLRRPDLPVGEAEFVAVVEDGGPREGEEQDHGVAGLRGADTGGDPRFVVTAGHPGRRRPGGQGGEHVEDGLLNVLGRPTRLEETEVQGQVDLVQSTPEVAAPGLPVVFVDLADRHAFRVGAVGLQQPAEVPVDVVQVGMALVVNMPLTVKGPHGAVMCRGVGRCRWVVAQRGVLGHEGDAVDAESVHTPVEPVAGHLEHGAPHLGMPPVEIRHGRQEGVQVVLAARPVQGPGGLPEQGDPVVGRAAVRRRIAPHVPVAPRVGPAPAGVQEPAVTARGVVGHVVDQHLQSVCVGRGDERVEVVGRSEQWIHCGVVGDVVSEIRHG